jgi:hypothetical protein
MEKFIDPMFSEHISGLACRGISEPLLDGHIGTAARRDIDDRVRAFCQSGQIFESAPDLLKACHPRVSGVEMENRGPSFGSLNGTVNDLGGSDGKILRHGWSVDRTGNCAGMMILRLFLAISVSIGSITER